MFFQEADCPNESGGKNSTNTEYFVALAKATEHLGIHRLVRIRAKNGFIWASVVSVRVKGPILKMGALVEASENWSSQKATRCLSLRFYEQKVHSFAFF